MEDEKFSFLLHRHLYRPNAHLGKSGGLGGKHLLILSVNFALQSEHTSGARHLIAWIVTAFAFIQQPISTHTQSSFVSSPAVDMLFRLSFPYSGRVGELKGESKRRQEPFVVCPSFFIVFALIFSFSF